MSKPKNDGGPAFPVPSGRMASKGLSVRDWLAGQALQGILAGRKLGLEEMGCDAFSARAYQWADAMLAEREGKQ